MRERWTETGHAWPSAGGGAASITTALQHQQGPGSSDAALPPRVGEGGARGGVRLHFEQQEETLLFGSILKRQLVYQSF